MEKENEIKLVQKPVITHALKIVGQSVTERLAELNLENQVATIDTVKTLKDLRADLNKELAEYEAQRKYIKGEVLNPYNEFDAIYKTEVSDKYNAALTLLKDKIAIVEDKVKSDKKQKVQTYFNELCVSEKIDFLKFDNVGLDINLSTTEKAYKEQVNLYVEKVIDDLALIDTQEYKAEILVEYKSTLNASKAIKTVQDRKKLEEEEEERLKVQKINNWKSTLLKIGMLYDDITNAYAYDDDIYITVTLLEALGTSEFRTKLIELQEAIMAKKIVETENTSVLPQTPIAPLYTPAAPIQAPTVEKPVELVTASFTVSGTMSQIKALGQYMKDNNITYKNI